MPTFDPLKYSYPSRRNLIYARNGMCASVSPIASQVGLDILKKSGNAADAAIAMAATLPLVEPTGCGIGADCFALVWIEADKRLYALDGSGVTPAALNGDVIRSAGLTNIPREGWYSCMVPAAPSAWALLRRHFGSRSMRELMEPAIRYAREGFCIPVTVWQQWNADVERIRKAGALYQPLLEYYTKNGECYKPGDLFRHPDYASTLESLAESDCDSLYHGQLMQKVVDYSRRTGGFFTEDDFRNYSARWVEPIRCSYKGYEVFEMPPNSHGVTVLMALKLLEKLPLAGTRESVDSYHLQIEAIKLAFADAQRYVADPRTMDVRVDDLLSDTYLTSRRSLITANALLPKAGDPYCGGTTYFCTADREGNMVSFIQSNFIRFGSGIAIPGTGIHLNSRGSQFSLDPSSANYLEGGKKCYHTIIPGFLCKDGQAVGPFGVMGGYMQPQGHVQLLVNTIDYHMNPQEALDAPRFQWIGGKKVQLEHTVPYEVAQMLTARGHEVEIPASSLGMGRGQIIWKLEDGRLVGGTEGRADGCIASF